MKLKTSNEVKTLHPKKRKKTVFSTNEIFHVFISQAQSEGKTPKRSGSQGPWFSYATNSYPRTIFFENKKIWSYGYHYLMGELHKGDKILLINSEKSSVTTESHKSSLFHASKHKRRFYVPDPSNPKNPENLEYLNEQIAEAFTHLVMGWANPKSKANWLKIKIDKYNEYCELFNINKKIKITDESQALLDEILSFKLEKFKIVAAKQAAKRESQRKAYEEAQRAKIPKLLNSAKRWCQGKSNSICGYQLKATFLRVVDSVVETSDGAKVPLNRAIKLYKAWIDGEELKGRKIGFYEVTWNTLNEIQIGCHNLKLKEVERVLGPYLNKPELKLV